MVKNALVNEDYLDITSGLAALKLAEAQRIAEYDQLAGDDSDF